MQRFFRGLAFMGLALGLLAPTAGRADDGPDKAFLTMASGLSEGKLESIWAMLPGTYQSDLKALISDFAGKMDGELWTQTFTVAKKLTKVLRDKKDFILSNPQLAALPIDKDTLSKGWDPLVNILDSILDSDLSDLTKLKSPDPENFLKTTGSKVLKGLQEIAPLVPGNNMKEEMEDMKSASATVVKVDGDKATIKTKVGKKDAKETEVVKVDGKWIPKEMAEGWAKFMTQAKSQLGNIKTDEIAQKKPAVMGAMKKLAESLDKLAAAKTAQDFESELGNLVAAAQGLGAGG